MAARNEEAFMNEIPAIVPAVISLIILAFAIICWRDFIIEDVDNYVKSIFKEEYWPKHLKGDNDELV